MSQTTQFGQLTELELFALQIEKRFKSLDLSQ